MTATGWIALVTLVVIYTALVLAIVATRPHRHWLSTPAVAVVTVLLITGIDLDGIPSIDLVGYDWEGPVVAAATIAMGVVGGSPIVAIVLKLASSGSVPAGTHGGILVRDLSARAPVLNKEVLRGGATIGFLERLALIGTVLAGQAAAVAVIVAVKGLGRYSELESAEARERFIIGTLASLLWAGACAAAAYLWI